MYYISYLFKETKLRYTGLEKLTMGLTLIARRLHPHFLSHLIVVLTDTPLEYILSNPEAMGRRIK